jgi:hypothetical protein
MPFRPLPHAALHLLPVVLAVALPSRALEPVRLSADGTGFVLGDTGTPFAPWGFNYLGEEGELLEEVWADRWDAIAEDFRAMRAEGANTVRIHLQLATYLEAPDRVHEVELDRLRRLLDLARDTGLRLDLTGLSCYRKDRVPAWYNALSEAERWRAQAVFWRAIAARAAGHPAVFCYNLMNEPVIGAPKPGEDPWLTGELGGFHFVQRISHAADGRPAADIAAAWVRLLVESIRTVDPHTLVTVGVIPWAQVWPNAKPVFYAPAARRHLDFVSVHFYPRAGRLAEDLAALAVYDLGKPLVVEEIFPLHGSLEDLAAFMDGARPRVDGWISHYFGRTPAEHRAAGDLPNAIKAAFLDFWRVRPEGRR